MQRALLAALMMLGATLWGPAAAAQVPLKTCVLPARTGQAPATLFAHPEGFSCNRRQTDFGSGDFWILSQPLPAVARGPVYLRTSSVWQDRVSLFIRYRDGAIRRMGFTSATTGRHLRLGAVIQLALPQRLAPPVQILWHVEGSLNRRGILNGAALVTPADAHRIEVVTAALYAAFAGICLALLIFNLALWAALRQAFQPAYCAMVLCLFAYAGTSSGLLGQLTAIDNNDRLRINYVLLAVSAAAAVVFARTFLERRVFDGWLRPFSNAAITILLGATLGFALFAPRFAALTDLFSTFGYMLILGLIVPVLWRAWSRRSNYLWLFALAWAAPVALAGLRVLAALNVIPWHNWVDQSTLLAMALEAGLSSLGVAYRIRLLCVERDTAREQESEARLLAATDPLTNLLNRRAFLDRAIGQQGEHQLILVDVDHFKSVNEAIGHDGGDEVLRVIARVLRAAAPVEALVARVGGEEFAILTSIAAPVQAAAVLDRLRAERMPFDLSITASIGSCIGPLTDEADWKALYRCADHALFEAKATGRDRARESVLLRQAA